MDNISLHSYSHYLSEIIGGAYAGLAAVTPGSGYVSPTSALIIGIIGGITSFHSVTLIKDKLLVDDVLDVTTIAGAVFILVGVFAESKHQKIIQVPMVLLSRKSRFIFKTSYCTSVIIVWSAVLLNLFFIIPYICVLDVTSHVDEIGLDFDQLVVHMMMTQIHF